MAQDNILIATSIVPGARQDIQAAAVQSWLDHGFHVASLNAPDEIDRLRGTYPGVDFILQMRTGKLETGRPVIYLSDMLHHLKESGRRTLGIVNSDIYLPPNPKLPNFVSGNTEKSLLFGPRQEVPEFGTGEGKMDPFGFDYFFFDSEILRIWPECKFCLGMPFWDLWFPLVPIFAGVAAKKLISPAARHIPHPTQRDDSFFMFNNEFVEVLLPQLGKTPDGAETFGAEIDGAAYPALLNEARTSQASGAPEAERLAALENLAAYLDELTRYVIGYIDRNSEKIELA
ncbi:MAG: hypothetical protein QGH73_09395 [Rhodospirillales bacterium]|nr:hypothetical protein [Rhodospirillales bacterium]